MEERLCSCWVAYSVRRCAEEKGLGLARRTPRCVGNNSTPIDQSFLGPFSSQRNKNVTRVDHL